MTIKHLEYLESWIVNHLAVSDNLSSHSLISVFILYMKAFPRLLRGPGRRSLLYSYSTRLFHSFASFYSKDHRARSGNVIAFLGCMNKLNLSWWKKTRHCAHEGPHMRMYYVSRMSKYAMRETKRPTLVIYDDPIHEFMLKLVPRVRVIVFIEGSSSTLA